MRASWHSVGLCAALTVLGCQPANIDVLTNFEAPSLPQHTTTKFLHWGAGQPAGEAELRWLVEHLSDVEATPFDGMVLDLGVATSLFTVDLTEASFSASADLIRTAPFHSFTDNFQKLDLAPLDLSDDAAWDRMAQNLTLIARVVRDAGLRGFMLDTQQYVAYPWSYARLPAGKGTFAQESARAFARGQQLLRAMLVSYPDVTVLETLGTSEVFREVCIEGNTLEQSDYAMLPAFLDGMRAAGDEARSGASLLDAFLPAYATRLPASFRLYHDMIHGDWGAMQAHWLAGVATYRWATLEDDQTLGESRWPDVSALLCSEAERRLLTRDVTASFSIMLDYRNAALGTDVFQIDPARFGENTHTPAAYTELLRSALQSSDRYVWSWSSSVLWWPKPGDNRAVIPPEYLDAARLARKQASGLADVSP